MPRANVVLIGVVLAVALTRASPAARTPADPFNNEAIQRLDLQVHSLDWAKLKADFWANQYYPADVTWHGETVRNVGIRSRGHSTRSGTKPGLRVDFDRYVSDQRMFGLRSVVLDNLAQDASGIHETVAMAFYARLGVPAPREAHARLYVNGEHAGLYVIVESIDKELLARVFGSIGDDAQNDGYLYEFKNVAEWWLEYLGPSLEPYKTRLEARTHERRSDEELYRPLETLVRLVNETPIDRFVETVGSRLDLAALVRYVAAQNLVAELDGFLGNWGVNNFYLYRLEGEDAHVLIAWDADLSFERPDLPINARHASNRLMVKVMSLPEYSALYASELRRAADLAAEEAWLEGEITRQVQLTRSAMLDDTLRPFSQSEYENAAAAMLAFADARIGFVRCELERGTGACP